MFRYNSKSVCIAFLDAHKKKQSNSVINLYLELEPAERRKKSRFNTNKKEKVGCFTLYLEQPKFSLGFLVLV